ncbi:MAG: hypothetical protein LBM07_05040 [Culturomica sp.]|jgi:hypothetical protein|nr:hypothetical protein [Culturomica sp.]
MLYIIIGIAGLLLIVGLFTFLFGRKSKNPESTTTIDDKECCGAHEICEKGLRKISLQVEYFNDEELDTFQGTEENAYSDEQIDIFRDILYTMKTTEIPDWLTSLEKRKITLPYSLRQEIIDLLTPQTSL